MMNRNLRRTLERFGQQHGIDLTVDEAFALAVHHHRAGRIGEAEDCYRRILEVEPEHLDSLNNLGAALRRQGRLDEAVIVYQYAVALRPNVPEVLNNLGAAAQAQGHYAEAVQWFMRAAALRPRVLGLQLNLGVAQLLNGQPADAAESLMVAVEIKSDHVEALIALGTARQSLGQFKDAASCFHRALKQKPDHVQALVNLGNVHQSAHRPNEAAACFVRALAVDPQVAEAWYNLGNVHLNAGRPVAAAACYRQALCLRPAYARALLNLGSALLEAPESREDAVLCFERALQCDTALAPAHMNLGNVLQAEHRFREALERYDTALRLAPNYVEAHVNLASTLQAMDRSAEAIARLRAIIAFAPEVAAAHLNLALALRHIGALGEAENHYRQALVVRPEYPEAEVGLAMVLLLQGIFAEGWQRYEGRWQVRDWPTAPRDNLLQPLWQGEPLAGRTILVHAEQGLGDIFQFARYVPLLARQDGTVILQAPASALPALHGLAGVQALIEDEEPLPPFDLHCPLMSLPRLFGTTLETIPASAPYLALAPEALERAQACLGAPRAGRLRVGLAWGGNPAHRLDRYRSIPLADFAPLCNVTGVDLFGVQIGERREEMASLNWRRQITDLAPHLRDFGETAAVLQQLDLLITVDTALAHLAGALARPTWVLLPFAPDWRWLTERSDSPWYPTMRLFRQPYTEIRDGAWDSTITQVVAALQAAVPLSMVL